MTVAIFCSFPCLKKPKGLTTIIKKSKEYGFSLSMMSMYVCIFQYKWWLEGKHKNFRF